MLAEAWTLASRWRNAAVLWRGRPVDALPVDTGTWTASPGSSAIRRGRGEQAEDDYLRLTRRARQVVDRVFYA